MLPATQIITFLIGSAVVIFGAYYATYMVAKGSRRVYKGRAIQVLDRFSLTKDRYIVLLGVYDKVYLIAFSSDTVSLLDTLESQTAKRLLEESLPAAPLARGQSFNTSWAGFIRKLKKTDAAKEHIPFESYLHGEDHDKRTADDMSSWIKNRKEKEDQSNTVLDKAFKEDILK
ncbi:MAG: flagellar biosynthetic protein FliO [Clostridiales bacterium]|nr:flagellar biosynthetic protein FliO [Clostridiales bacterium]